MLYQLLRPSRTCQDMKLELHFYSPSLYFCLQCFLVPLLLFSMQDSGVNSNQHMAAIITAIVRIGGGIVSIFLIHKLPRVKLAMAAMSLMSISIIALGTVIYFKDQYEDNIVFQVLPIVLVTLYMFSFGAGKGDL